jgi:hypothetical protein
MFPLAVKLECFDRMDKLPPELRLEVFQCVGSLDEVIALYGVCSVWRESVAKGFASWMLLYCAATTAWEAKQVARRGVGTLLFLRDHVEGECGATRDVNSAC